MKNKTFIGLIIGMALITVGCSKDSTQESELNYLKKATTGAIQLNGVGYFDSSGECDTEGKGADYSLIMTGDLEGCLYTYVESFDCSPGGTYMEIGREYYVGTYNGVYGTFWTTYKFEAKYEGCDDGSIVGAELKGRCQHPIVEGKSTGVFKGVTGRLDMKDDIQPSGSINYVYRGHLKGLN